MLTQMRSNSSQRLTPKQHFAAYLSVSYDIVSAAPPLSEPAVDRADLVRVRLPGEATADEAAMAAAAVGVEAAGSGEDAAGARVSGLALAAVTGAASTGMTAAAATGSETGAIAGAATAAAAAGALSTSST